MHRSIIVFAAVLAIAYGQTAVSQCIGNSAELPASTTIVGCSTPPCGLPQLQDAVIDIEFIAPRNLASMTTLATAYLGIIPVPYNLAENAVTCNFLQNTTCPVSQGQLVKYQLRMHIENFFPVGVAPTIEFRIVDDSAEPVVCLRVPIRVEQPAARAAN